MEDFPTSLQLVCDCEKIKIIVRGEDVEAVDNWLELQAGAEQDVYPEKEPPRDSVRDASSGMCFQKKSHHKT